jgi:hypothetical protein
MSGKPSTSSSFRTGETVSLLGDDGAGEDTPAYSVLKTRGILCTKYRRHLSLAGQGDLNDRRAPN